VTLPFDDRNHRKDQYGYNVGFSTIAMIETVEIVLRGP
jgi:hypothetical protein